MYVLMYVYIAVCMSDLQYAWVSVYLVRTETKRKHAGVCLLHQSARLLILGQLFMKISCAGVIAMITLRVKLESEIAMIARVNWWKSYDC